MIVSYTGFFISVFLHYRVTIVFLLMLVLLTILYILNKYNNSKTN